MPGRYGDLGYPTLTKRAFLLGTALFVCGLAGEYAVRAAELRVPAWEETLLFDLIVVGLLVAFLSPIVFGVILPLTE